MAVMGPAAVLRDYFNPIKRMLEETTDAQQKTVFADNGGIPQAYRTPPTWDVDDANQEKGYNDMFSRIQPSKSDNDSNADATARIIEEASASAIARAGSLQVDKGATAAVAVTPTEPPSHACPTADHHEHSTTHLYLLEWRSPDAGGILRPPKESVWTMSLITRGTRAGPGLYKRVDFRLCPMPANNGVHGMMVIPDAKKDLAEAYSYIRFDYPCSCLFNLIERPEDHPTADDIERVIREARLETCLPPGGSNSNGTTGWVLKVIGAMTEAGLMSLDGYYAVKENLSFVHSAEGEPFVFPVMPGCYGFQEWYYSQPI